MDKKIQNYIRSRVKSEVKKQLKPHKERMKKTETMLADLTAYTHAEHQKNTSRNAEDLVGSKTASKLLKIAE